MPKPSDDALLALSRIPLFQAFSREELATLAAETRMVTVDSQAHLFHRGDQSKGFYLVLAGQMQLFVSSASGNEKIVEIIGPGGTFGEAVMFLQQPYPVSARALSDSRCLEISSATVDRLIGGQASFARRMLAGLSMRLRGLVQDVESYSLQNSAQRVITYLLQLCPDQGDGPQVVQLPISKFIIASRLNLTPETLSRVLHDLSARGLIVLKGRRIQIASLSALAKAMG